MVFCRGKFFPIRFATRNRKRLVYSETRNLENAFDRRRGRNFVPAGCRPGRKPGPEATIRGRGLGGFLQSGLSPLENKNHFTHISDFFPRVFDLLFGCWFKIPKLKVPPKFWRCFIGDKEILKNRTWSFHLVFQPQTETQFSSQQNEINDDCKLTSKNNFIWKSSFGFGLHLPLKQLRLLRPYTAHTKIMYKVLDKMIVQIIICQHTGIRTHDLMTFIFLLGHYLPWTNHFAPIGGQDSGWPSSYH